MISVKINVINNTSEGSKFIADGQDETFPNNKLKE